MVSGSDIFLAMMMMVSGAAERERGVGRGQVKREVGTPL